MPIEASKAPESRDPLFHKILEDYVFKGSEKAWQGLALATEMRKDKGSFREIENAFIRANTTSAQKPEVLRYQLRNLLMQHSANGQGVFFKSLDMDPVIKNVDSTFELATKLHEAAPEYTPKIIGKLKGKDGETIGVMTELIADAKSLSEYLDKNSKLELPKGVEEQLLDYVKKIHSKGLMQGDLNPDNILISKGRLFVVDPLVRDLDKFSDYTIKIEQADAKAIADQITKRRQGLPIDY